jgi:hypothetical protein
MTASTTSDRIRELFMALSDLARQSSSTLDDLRLEIATALGRPGTIVSATDDDLGPWAHELGVATGRRDAAERCATIAAAALAFAMAAEDRTD